MKKLLAPVLAASLASVAVASFGFAQDRQAPTFETASIKPAPPDETRRGARGQPGGRQEYYNMTLRTLVRVAYDGGTLLMPEQFVGGPKWVDEDRFNIVAKAEGDPGFDASRVPTRYRAMLQALLKERFELRVHTEMREADVFTLTVANKDGKLGPRLEVSTADCYTAPPPPGTPVDPARRCGFGNPVGRMRGIGVTMSELAAGVSGSPSVGRLVLDRTGLKGRYHLYVEFVPSVIPGPTGATPVPNPAADSGANVFTAFQEQLGLKLQAAKAPIEFLVIDGAEKPTED